MTTHKSVPAKRTTGKRTQTGPGKKRRIAEAGRFVPDPGIEEISLYAYAIWEREGHPEGRDAEHWQQAEAQLREERRQAGPRTAGRERV